ncbi:hypothetical protein D3C78_1679630 [compost metagenome]
MVQRYVQDRLAVGQALLAENHAGARAPLTIRHAHLALEQPRQGTRAHVQLRAALLKGQVLGRVFEKALAPGSQPGMLGHRHVSIDALGRFQLTLDQRPGVLAQRLVALQHP